MVVLALDHPPNGTITYPVQGSTVYDKRWQFRVDFIPDDVGSYYLIAIFRHRKIRFVPRACSEWRGRWYLTRRNATSVRAAHKTITGIMTVDVGEPPMVLSSWDSGATVELQVVT